jgi:hypothetical protein
MIKTFNPPGMVQPASRYSFQALKLAGLCALAAYFGADRRGPGWDRCQGARSAIQAGL